MNESRGEPGINCKDFVGQGWRQHGDDAEGVMSRLPQGVSLVREADDIPALAALIVHVAGEHLGRWQEGLDLLQALSDLDCHDAESPVGRALSRSRAVLHYCAGEGEACERAIDRGHPPGDLPEPSTRARVLAIAASALQGRARLAEAAAAFAEALRLAGYGPTKDDPLARALAVTANNLACELEEKSDRSPEEDALLESAATAARRFWEIAGDWTNVKIAEVRLCMSFLALGRAEQALEHARKALELCEENGGGPSDRFFPHEALARAYRALGDREAAAAERTRMAQCLPAMDASWGDHPQETLRRLDALLAS